MAKRDIAKDWPAGGLVISGLVVLVFLLGGIAGWSALAEISGAVVAQAQLRMESKQAVVQHLEGGIVAEIFAQDGDVVAAGSPLLRLDGTAVETGLEIVEAQLDELLAREARLQAEQRGLNKMQISTRLAQRMAARDNAKALVDGQSVLFQARLDAHTQRLQQNQQRIAQSRNQIRGFEAQIQSYNTQRGLVQSTLKDQTDLLQKGLTTRARVSALEREDAQLSGQLATARTAIAQAYDQIAELQAQRTGLTADRREQSVARLRDITAGIAEMEEKRIALLDQQRRLLVVAPSAGTVLKLAVTSFGAVVAPGAELLRIVPEGKELIVDAKVDSYSRDQIWQGQSARIVFSGFNQRATPQITAHVTYISADATREERSGESYYQVELSIAKSELDRLSDATRTELAPGMPVEVFISTGARSVASYLLKPLTDNFRRALREE